MSAGAGDDARLEVVPFTNGQDPTKEFSGSFVGYKKSAGSSLEAGSKSI
jgi:hypothetical protein